MTTLSTGLLALVLVGCRAPARPDARPAPAPASRPAARSPFDCESVPQVTIQGRTFTSPGAVITAYCSQSSDGCCLDGGQWNCNNARYVDWWMQACPGR